MNSTPNYSFDKNIHICALDAVDREIKRLEDKIDCRQKAACELSPSYNKCETDRLLDGKVDKEDGYSLISNDCLHQICTNKGDISLLEEYIKELREQNAGLKEYIDSELSNKVNIGPPQVYKLALAEGIEEFSGKSSYAKMENQYVHVIINIKKEDDVPFNQGRNEIAILPEGFRPDGRVHVVASANNSLQNYRGTAPQPVVTVDADGRVGVYIYDDNLVSCATAIGFFAV